MKKIELKLPFSWNDRKILIKDKIWYVPNQITLGDDFVFPGWGHPDIFGNRHPIYVEYCSGNGDWVIKKAEANPLINWIAVEKKFDRVRKIWSKMKKLKINNLLVIHGDAQNATALFFPSESIEKVFINFPDPWPKNRHAKHRVIQPEFAEQLWRILQTKSSLTFVTDDELSSSWLIDIMHKHGRFKSQFPNPFYCLNLDDYGSSYFEELWRMKGRQIRYHQFTKLEN